ncbi:MAG: hypothetical protein ACI9FJ_003231 [Alteromonadaceae bacterium]|jgi:hypothetical protein
MSEITALATMAITVLQQQINHHGYTPRVHFELEGGYRRANPAIDINYPAINQALKQLNILGSLKPEYWPNQWEYVSDFVGQTPLKEATDFAAASRVLPRLLKQQGAAEVFIRPVLWSADEGRLQPGCVNIFSTDKRPVHIPNAVQINISAEKAGRNSIPHQGFGEILQQRLLDTSYECCLLYLPENEAFERLQLKDNYDLDAELSSPHELSGGHQGSIALYKEVGKHNQLLGVNPLIFDHQHQMIASTVDWHSLSRVEHRLGASSDRYNPFVNVVFALANLFEAIIEFEADEVSQQAEEPKYDPQIPRHTPQALPEQLFSEGEKVGAFEIFERGSWFSQSINQSLIAAKAQNANLAQQIPDDLGDRLKQQIIASYNRKLLIKI